VFRLRGHGVKPVRGGGAGDLLCTIVVETPVELTRKQKDCCAIRGTLERPTRATIRKRILAGESAQFIGQHLKS